MGNARFTPLLIHHEIIACCSLKLQSFSEDIA